MTTEDDRTIIRHCDQSTYFLHQSDDHLYQVNICTSLSIKYYLSTKGLFLPPPPPTPPSLLSSSSSTFTSSFFTSFSCIFFTFLSLLSQLPLPVLSISSRYRNYQCPEKKLQQIVFFYVCLKIILFVFFILKFG